LFLKKFINKKGAREMSSWLIIVTGLIYLYIGCEQGFKGNIALCITYVSYAAANVGLYLMAK